MTDLKWSSLIDFDCNGSHISRLEPYGAMVIAYNILQYLGVSGDLRSKRSKQI